MNSGDTANLAEPSVDRKGLLRPAHTYDLSVNSL